MRPEQIPGVRAAGEWNVARTATHPQSIVRAIATDPEVLLLDEITSALDPLLVGEVLELVRSLAEDGATILMATHEMAFARDVAHRVLFLDAGTVIEQGTPAQIFGEPREARTRDFLARFTGP